jgi:hypothetical protein
MRNTLLQLDTAYLHACFQEGKRCGSMRDGHYHVTEDSEFVMMCCGGGEL